MKRRTAWQPWFVTQLITWTFGFAIGISVGHVFDWPGGSGGTSQPRDAGGEQRAAARNGADDVWPARHLFVAVNGQWLAEGTKELLREVKPGGVLLSEENMRSAAQTRALVAEIRRAVGTESGVTPFIAVAHEGGQANILDLAEAPSAAEIGISDDEAWARELGKAYGRECAARGIDVVFSPVLDVYESSTVFPSLSSRSFGSDPAGVARFGLAMAEGLRDGGVLAVAKHFPGYGAATYGADGIQAIAKQDIPGLAKTMLPFNEAVRQGVPGILVGHIVVPALDPEGGDRSAALSPVLVDQVLREKWGFEGVIIAEESALNAMTRALPAERAVVEALIAGCDAVIFLDPDPQRIRRASLAIRDAVDAGELSVERLNESKRRLDAWRGWIETHQDAPMLPAGAAHAAAVGPSEAELRAEAAEERTQAEIRARLKAEADAEARAAELERMKADALALAEAEKLARVRARQEEQLRAEAEARANEADRARLQAEAAAAAKRKEDADRAAAEAEKLARAQAEADARKKAEAEARAKAEEEKRLKAEEAKRVQQEIEAREKAEAEARAKAEEDARLKAEAEARAKAEAAEDDGLVVAPPAETETEPGVVQSEPLNAPDGKTEPTLFARRNDSDSDRPASMFGLTEIGHEVRLGETLGHIASAYEVESTDIIRWNGLEETAVNPGDRLRLYLPAARADKILSMPADDRADPQETVHAVKSGENLTTIARRYKVTVRDIVLWNDLSNSHLEAGQDLTLFIQPESGSAKPEFLTHRVRPGDTLNEIAQKYKTSTKTLIQLNNLRNANHIWVGQRLKIPNNA